MAATITYASSRVTISGPYKAFLGAVGSTTTVVQYASGEAPAAGDANRFLLWCKGGTTDTAEWEVRAIVSATAAAVTVHDPFSAVPASGDTLRISSTMDDILTAQPSAGTKTGAQTFYINGDFSLASAAFLGSRDQSVEWAKTTFAPLMADNTVLQVGVLWGGELAGTETTNGSRWQYRQAGAGDSSVYSVVNSRSASGPVLHFFGSLIESSVGSGFLFQRMRGPARFIGSIFDGVIGGRFYHEASAWAECRMSGNNNSTPAWSIGATFTRTIDAVVFYRNLAAFKTYQGFGGTMRNCDFSDSNTYVIRAEAFNTSIVNFIDCTDVPDDKVQDVGAGTFNHFRSINFTTTDETGAALADVAIRVNNASDTLQGAIQVSDGAGVCGEILALRRQWVDGSPSSTFAPFRIRIRKYGFLWASLNAAVADPIRQTYAAIANPFVTQASGTAAAHTGITVVDHGTPVAWNTKNFSITITGDKTVNPALTLDDIQHYLHWHLAQTAAFGGKASGLNWHELSPLGQTETVRGSYAGGFKGVRVIDENGDPFPGFTRMQADDGTYYVVPVTLPINITGFVNNTRIIIYNETTDTELYDAKVASSPLVLNYVEGGDYSVGDVIRVYHAFYGGSTAKLKGRVTAAAGVSGWSVTVEQEDDDVYAAYVATFSTTGEDVYNDAEWAKDGPNLQADLDDGDDIWYAHRLYLWDAYQIWNFDDNRDFLLEITATDEGNINIGNLLLDNLNVNTAYQGDTINVVNGTSTLPVVNPTTGGGGITMYSGGKILTTASSGLAPSEAQIKSWVRAELAAEMVRIFEIGDKTDQLNFAVSGQVDANTKSMNDAEVLGTGAPDNKWRGDV